MSLPRAKDVPATAGVSGLVFVLAMLGLGNPTFDVALFAVWGAMYVVESQVRRRTGHTVTATEPAAGQDAPGRAAAPHDATGDGRS
jgi:hypothetical protein